MQRNGLNTFGLPAMEKETVNQTPFPSLGENALKQLGLFLKSHEEPREPDLNEEDIKNKFTSLILAFKTDKLTLKRRLEIQNRIRDQTELNVNNELEALRAALQVLDPILLDLDKQYLYDKIITQMDALRQSTLRVSSAAELYGAVQQENRLSKAVDIIILHLEYLKEVYDKEKAAHEETRKVLEENKLSAAAIAAMQKEKRRASIATLHQQRNHVDSAIPHVDLRSSYLRKGSTIRRLLNSKSETISETPTSSRKNSVTDLLPTESETSEPTFLLRRKSDIDSKKLSKGNSISSELESESEEEIDASNLPKDEEEEDFTEEPVILASPHKVALSRKRSSLHMTVPWIVEVAEYIKWGQSFEDFVLRARYCVAVGFVLTAIAIVSSAFIYST